MQDKPVAPAAPLPGADLVDAGAEGIPHMDSYSSAIEHEAEKVSREPSADNLDALVRAILNDALHLTGKLDADIRRAQRKEAA